MYIRRRATLSACMFWLSQTCFYGVRGDTIAIRTCEAFNTCIAESERAVVLIYDGYTNKKRTVFRSLNRAPGYEDLGVTFMTVDVSNEELRRCVQQRLVPSRCLVLNNISQFPAYVFFERGRITTVKTGNPSEESLKWVLNKSLAKDPQYAACMNDPLFGLSQDFLCNAVKQNILPTSVVLSIPDIKRLIPASYAEVFSTSCFSRCPQESSCPETNVGCCGGGCTSCGYAGEYGGCGLGGCGYWPGYNATMDNNFNNYTDGGPVNSMGSSWSVQGGSY